MRRNSTTSTYNNTQARDSRITSIVINPEASTTIKEHVHDFETSITLLSKIVAYQRRDNIVLRSHVEEAVHKLRGQQTKNRTRELLIVIGSGLFGAFIPGFITELTSGRTTFIVLYTMLGFIGMVLVFLGLQK